jgi:Contractile injection system tape measure protein
MHPEHRIDEFTLDLSFTTTRLARREKAGLVSWISEDLLPALDRLFSQYSPGNLVLRFETLEFDLGKLDARHYQQQIREQLLEQFTRLLKSQMLALDPRALSSPPLVPLIPDANTALQQLIAYLSTGNITAHYAFNRISRYSNENDRRQSQEKIHQQLFEQVIAQQDIAELLRQFPARELLVARLVKQFSAAQRLILLRQLAPQQLPQVQMLLDLMEFIGQQQEIFSTATTQVNEFLTTHGLSADSLTAARVFASEPTLLRQNLWQQVLLLALESPQVSEAVWLTRLLDKLATSLAISKMQLGEFLLAIPLPTAHVHPLKHLQTRIAQLIQPVNSHTETQQHDAGNTDRLILHATDTDVNTGRHFKYLLVPRKQQLPAQNNPLRSLIFRATRVRGHDNQFIFQSAPDNVDVYAQQNSIAYLPSGTSPADLLPENIANIPRTLLQQKIAQALVSADINLLKAIWPTMATREPALLLSALQHYLPQAEIRQQLMMQLPLSMQADIIGFLATDIKPLFLHLQQMAGELVNTLEVQIGNDGNVASIDPALTDGADKIRSESAAYLQRRLWEIAVGLILSSSLTTGAAVYTTNPAAFLHRLIDDYAHINSLNAQHLQQLWRQVIQPITVEPNFISQQTVTQGTSEACTNNEQPGSAVSPTGLSTAPLPENALPRTASPQTNLDNISDHQLFDLCLRLKSGAVSWLQISFDVALLKRMIDSYIRLGHSATAENCRDFVVAIDHQAATTYAPTEFYSAVLQALIADKLVDLEAIASAIARVKSSSPINAINGDEINLVQTPPANITIAPDVVSADDIDTQIRFTDEQRYAAEPAENEINLRRGERTEEKAVSTIDTAVTDKLYSLPLEMQEIIPANISAIAESQGSDTQPHKQLQQSPDLELVVNIENANAQSISLALTASPGTSPATSDDLPFATNPLATAADRHIGQNQTNDGNKNLYNTQSQINADRTAQLSSMDDAAINTQHAQIQPANLQTLLQSLLVTAQPLAHLQQLNLSNDQWQDVCGKLIQHQAIIDNDAAVDLLQSIKTFAQQSLNIAGYYRKVVHALLQQQPIDLELFARSQNDDAQNSSLALTSSTSINPTISDAPQTIKPVTLTASGYTSQKTDVTGDKDLPATQSQIETEKALALSSKDDNPQLKAQHTQAPPPKMQTSVQNLLAAAQPLVLLQQLNLNNDHWQEICNELILHQAMIDNDTAIDLLQSIKAFAQQALHSADYYRKVVNALLQKQPIDLELFATSPRDNAQPQVDALANSATMATDLQTTLGQTINLLSGRSDQATTDPDTPSRDTTDGLSTIRLPDVSPATNTPIPLLTGSDDSLRKPVISLAQLLSVEATFTHEQLLLLQQHINFLLQHATTDVVREWLELLGEIKHHSPLIRAVPAHLLHQIAMRLQPMSYPPLDALVKVVNEAIALLTIDNTSLSLKQAKWEFIFHTLFVLRPSTLDKKQITDTLCHIFATAVGIDDVQRLLNLAERRAALLTPPARQQPAMRLQDLQAAQKATENTYPWEAGIPVNNAGQVLAAAFMPRLFAMLELTQEGKFVHPGAADRAAHLVQFMVSGETHTPEYELTLNKILCGISTSLPVSEGIELSEHEKNIIEQMLTSMIQHWKVLGSTSIAGLRETFFQRQGWLVLEEDCWRLKVQERTFDMLLDRLPWSISLIKHSWMDKPLRVSWRDQS